MSRHDEDDEGLNKQSSTWKFQHQNRLEVTSGNIWTVFCFFKLHNEDKLRADSKTGSTASRCGAQAQDTNSARFNKNLYYFFFFSLDL